MNAQAPLDLANLIPSWYYPTSILPGLVSFDGLPIEIWPFVIVNLLILVTGSATGLACVWAGLGRPHWFLRMATVTVVASLALLIPAYELLIWFFTQAVVTIPPLLIFERCNARRKSADGVASGEDSPNPRRWLQWSLRDQLLSCILLSGVIAAAVSIPSEIWASWVPLVLVVLVGLTFGICTLVGTWAAFSKRRLWLRLAPLCLFPPSAIIACWLALLGTYRQDAKCASLKPGTVWLVRVALATFSLLIFAPPAAMFCFLLHRTPIPASSGHPDPNGFADLVRAAKTLDKAYLDITHSRKPGSGRFVLETASEDELRMMVSASAEGLAIARVGLNRDCQVPLDYSGYLSSFKQPNGLLGLARVQYALKLESELAEREGRTADAARSYLDTIRLGYCARGGTTSDAYIGWGFQGWAIKRLRHIGSRLTSRQSRDLARELYLLESNAEPPESFVTREFAAVDHSWRWQDRISFRFLADNRTFRNRYRLWRAWLRLLMSRLALQAYHEDHGAWPESLADLAPRYLPGVPEDPFNGQAMPYHRTSQGYHLYCVPPSGPGIAPTWKEHLDFSYDGSDE